MSNANTTDSSTNVTSAQPAKSSPIVPLLAGLVGGVLATGLAVWLLMPGMMIVTSPSPLSFDETVAALEQAIADNGWSSPGTMDMQESIAKHGREFGHRVKVIKLCHPDYAADVLATDRHVSCLMPCSISVWESDTGEVFVSKMNTGLMGKLFGGNIAEVMGGKVARDEKQILSAIHAQ